MTGLGNALRPDLNDIRFTYDVFSDIRVVLLGDLAFRCLMALILQSATTQVWTYSEPDPAGLLDYDDAEFSRICRISLRRWKKVRPELEPFFKIEKRGWTFCRDWIQIGEGDTKRPAIPASLRSAVMHRDKFTCGYCGTQTGPFHCDHIVPIKNGGATHIENLICACATCNLSKSASGAEDWINASANVVKLLTRRKP